MVTHNLSRNLHYCPQSSPSKSSISVEDDKVVLIVIVVTLTTSLTQVSVDHSLTFWVVSYFKLYERCQTLSDTPVERCTLPRNSLDFLFFFLVIGRKKDVGPKTP